MTDPEPEPAPSIPPAPATDGPWGLAATAGLSLIIALGFVGAQTLVVTGMVMLRHYQSQAATVPGLAGNGLVWSLAIFASAPVALGLSWLFAAMRSGITVREYLGLRMVPFRTMLGWCLALLALLVGVDLTTTLLNREIVPEVMLDAYRTAEVLPLMWLALVVGAPLAEEVFFRGFLFKGLLHSRLGASGAIVVTSGVWSGIHLQYDLYGIAIIFVTGLLFGFARARTGSIYPGIVMHALMNLVATFQVDWMVRAGGTPSPPCPGSWSGSSSALAAILVW